MGILTSSVNLTFDGCVDYREGIADEETHALFTRLMVEREAMLWGRVTCTCRLTTPVREVATAVVRNDLWHVGPEGMNHSGVHVRDRTPPQTIRKLGIDSVHGIAI